MNQLIALFVAAFFSTIASAAEPSTIAFDMAGMRVGDPLTEEFRYHHCPAKDKEKPDPICHRSVEFGTSELLVLYHFADFKLATVTVSFSPDHYDDLIAAYTSKFGAPPGHQWQETVQTGTGRLLTNRFATWSTDSGAFTVRKYGTRVTRGMAHLDSPQWRAYLQRNQEIRRDDLGGKL